MDVLGKRVWQQTAKGGIIMEWNTAKGSNGTYFYSIHSGTEMISSGKIIKLDK